MLNPLIVTNDIKFTGPLEEYTMLSSDFFLNGKVHEIDNIYYGKNSIFLDYKKRQIYYIDHIRSGHVVGAGGAKIKQPLLGWREFLTKYTNTNLSHLNDLFSLIQNIYADDEFNDHSEINGEVDSDEDEEHDDD